MSTVGTKPLRVGVCLSLSGQYSRFGTQAARALEVWASSVESVELTIEDDESSPRTLDTVFPAMASNADVLLGPYSTQLARRAARMAAQEGWLLWNQGGSGDDVESDYPGHCVSILTPTSQYADPYVQHLGRSDADVTDLWIVHSAGSFGRQVADGAYRRAVESGVTARLVAADKFGDLHPTEPWHLFSVGRFEDDVAVVDRARALAIPPLTICAVAAGVREFRDQVENHHDIYGIAQWFAGNPAPPLLGPAERDFMRAYSRSTADAPDYPAVQAIAGAIIAIHCATQAGSTQRDALWEAATGLKTRTLFGDFGVDPTTGMQLEHVTALVRWHEDKLCRV